jgi:hypothetical protein
MSLMNFNGWTIKLIPKENDLGAVRYEVKGTEVSYRVD